MLNQHFWLHLTGEPKIYAKLLQLDAGAAQKGITPLAAIFQKKLPTADEWLRLQRFAEKEAKWHQQAEDAKKVHEEQEAFEKELYYQNEEEEDARYDAIPDDDIIDEEFASMLKTQVIPGEARLKAEREVAEKYKQAIVTNQQKIQEKLKEMNAKRVLWK